MAEQLAVGEFASRRRAVVGKKCGGAAMRSHMNRARNELLARAAFAGDEDRQVAALQTLNLFHDACHRGTRAQKTREERFERPIEREADGGGRSIARGAERETLSRDRGNHAQPAHDGVADGPR